MNMFAQLMMPDPPPVQPKPKKVRKPRAAPRYAPVKNPWDLTPAQCFILECLCKGWSSVEVAQHTNVSEKTVYAQLDRARQRLAARNTTHACLLWDRWARPKEAA